MQASRLPLKSVLFKKIFAKSFDPEICKKGPTVLKFLRRATFMKFRNYEDHQWIVIDLRYKNFRDKNYKEMPQSWSFAIDKF